MVIYSFRLLSSAIVPVLPDRRRGEWLKRECANRFRGPGVVSSIGKKPDLLYFPIKTIKVQKVSIAVVIERARLYEFFDYINIFHDIPFCRYYLTGGRI
jgi:hypothetical protein